jgi:hypothetical protein
MPFFARVGRDGKATVCEAKSSTLDVPPHKGKIWLDGDVICLQFPSVDQITVGGRTSLQIVGHLVRFPADEQGITAAEAVLHIRQQMMQKGNEALLLAFAERGTDHSAILRLYEEILSGDERSRL